MLIYWELKKIVKWIKSCVLLFEEYWKEFKIKLYGIGWVCIFDINYIIECDFSYRIFKFYLLIVWYFVFRFIG